VGIMFALKAQLISQKNFEPRRRGDAEKKKIEERMD
jgi:hypothetical protein